MRLSDQRCMNHSGREAAARCPGCKRFFCRECVTEHDDQVLCSSCLARRLKQDNEPQHGYFRLVLLIASFFTAWLFYYWLGEILLLLPSSFHEGTFWKSLQ